MSKKTDCVCEWDDDNNVVSFCGAHMELHRKMLGDIAKTGVRCMEQRNEALAEVERLEKLVDDVCYTAKNRKKKMHMYRDTLISIGSWTQVTQDDVEKHDAGIMMWRGCSAEANMALERGGDAVEGREKVYPKGYLKLGEGK